MVNSNKRVVYIDVLRCLACFFVIVNHTVSTEISYHDFGCSWIILVTWFFLSKTAVPIFVMITGALLLQKEEPYARTIARIGRIVVVLCCVSIPYQAVYSGLKAGFLTSIRTAVLNIYQDGISNEFWYLYLYIGILLMLPLLRNMRANMQERDYLYFLIIVFFVNGLYPLMILVCPFLNTEANVNLAIFDSYIGYLFWGDYIVRYDKFSMKKHSIYAAIIFILAVALCTVITSKIFMVHKQNFFLLDNVALATTAVPSCCIFVLARNIFMFGYGIEEGNLVSIIGRCTFAMYLVSDAVIYKLKFIYMGLRGLISGIPAVFIYEIIVFFVCYLVARTLISIPGMKRIL